MIPGVRTQLREIGMQLDAGTYPHVFNDGVLALKRSIVDVETLGAENKNEQFGTSRPAAGSRQGNAGRQGTAGRSWSSGEAEPSGGRHLRENYLGQLGAVYAAYPRTVHWTCNEGMWLAVESSVLAGLDRSATFLIAVPFQSLRPVQAWAFWTTTISQKWIGPRHTNAIDGSVCAYNPAEGTWKMGGELVELIDQYNMWAFRHLHLEVLDWWPGKQTAEFAYERLTELNDNEWCGCGPDAKRYRTCCKPFDMAADRFPAAMEFVRGFLRFKPRQPPTSVIRFLWKRCSPPAFQKATVNPMLFAGSCLYPTKPGGRLSSAAGWMVPR